MTVDYFSAQLNQLGPTVDVRSFAPPGTPRDGSIPWDTFIQSAVNFILDGRDTLGGADHHFSTLLLPPGIYRIDRPIQIARVWLTKQYGGQVPQYAFCTIRISGEMPGQSHQHATVIKATFTDDPAILVQWGKSVILENMTILGKNVWTELPGRSPTDMATHYNRANYLATQAIRDTRHSPYAGIHIDPYANPPPADMYPGLEGEYTMMPGSGANQYSGSSGIQIRNCAIKGFTVGVAISLNGLTQNAENILIEDCTIISTKSAIAIGQTQSRNIILRNIGALGAECFVNCIDYGAGGGNCPAIFGGNVSGVKTLFKTASSGSTPAIQGLHCERIASLGVVGGGGGRDGHVFEACSFSFGATPKGYPAPTYRLANLAFASFIGCRFDIDDGAGRGNPEPLWMLNMGWMSFKECRFTNNLGDNSTFKTDRFWVNGNPERVSYDNVIVRVGAAESRLSNVLSVDYLRNFSNYYVVPGCLFYEVQGDSRLLRWVANGYPAVDLGSGHTVVLYNDGTATFVLPANQPRLWQVVRVGDFISTTTPLHPFGGAPNGPFGGPGLPFVIGKVQSVDMATGVVTLEFVPELVYEEGSMKMPQYQLRQQRLFARYWPKIHPRTIGDIVGPNQISIATPEALGRWSVGDRLVGVDANGSVVIPQGAYITGISGNIMTTSVNATSVGVTVKLYDADVRELQTPQI